MTKLTKLTIPTFDVLLHQPSHPEADSYGRVAYSVQVINGDQLRAELEAAKRKLPTIGTAPLHATSLWLWSACARLGHTQLGSMEFLATELVTYDKDKTAGQEEAAPLDRPPLSESD